MSRTKLKGHPKQQLSLLGTIKEHAYNRLYDTLFIIST